MNKEIEALETTNAWSLVQLPQGKHCIECKWVFKVKYRPDDSIKRYKVSYTQEEGVDYFYTFSPVVKITTVRILLSITIFKNWFIHQCDVKNVFTYGDLDEEAYMLPPPGYCSSNENRVCKSN